MTRCSRRRARTICRGSPAAAAGSSNPRHGPRDFSEGRPDWAVHVALAVGGAPVLGAVAIPALGRLFRSDNVALPTATRERPIMLVSRTRPPAEVEEIAALLGAELRPMG